MATTPTPPSLPAPPCPPHDLMLSPRLDIKKRKPRSSSVILAANQTLLTVCKVAPPPLPPPSALALPLQSPPSKPFTVSSRQSDSKRKGLRHFAVRVSRKVEEKQITTYNQVADELVAEERLLRKHHLTNIDQLPNDVPPCNEVLVDEKNIRRRVYDSLNVLMAMGIITKNKKLISWQGIESAQYAANNHETLMVNNAIADKKRAILTKRALLAELKEQYCRTSTVVQRNRSAALLQSTSQDDTTLTPSPVLPIHQQFPDRIGIPFFVVSAPEHTNIELEMDHSRQDICFTFNSSFAIFDDREVVRRMMAPPPLPPPSPPQPMNFDAMDPMSFQSP